MSSPSSANQKKILQLLKGNKIIKEERVAKVFCEKLDENFTLADMKLMLEFLGYTVTDKMTKDEMCSKLTKSIPRRVLESIVIYGKQVGKGSAVALVLILLMSAALNTAAMASPYSQAVVAAPLLYGVGTGVYQGVRRIFGMNDGTYKKFKNVRAFAPKKGGDREESNNNSKNENSNNSNNNSEKKNGGSKKSDKKSDKRSDKKKSDKKPKKHMKRWGGEKSKKRTKKTTKKITKH